MPSFESIKEAAAVPAIEFLKRLLEGLGFDLGDLEVHHDLGDGHDAPEGSAAEKAADEPAQGKDELKLDEEPLSDNELDIEGQEAPSEVQSPDSFEAPTEASTYYAAKISALEASGNTHPHLALAKQALAEYDASPDESLLYEVAGYLRSAAGVA